jgi:hypothetical protein
MNYALYDNKKVSAEEYKKSENLDLRCPCCNSQVVAKQGEINVWHFSHKVKNECSNWFKPMTEWHLNWQKQFPEKNREIIHKCEQTGEKHIADVKTDNGIVIEFQHSSITPQEIRAREEFYGEKMIWVLDASKFKVELVAYPDKTPYKESINYDLESLSETFKTLSYLKIEKEKYIKYKQSKKFKTKSYFFDICKNPVFIDTNDGNLIYFRFKQNEFINFTNDFKIIFHKKIVDTPDYWNSVWITASANESTGLSGDFTENEVFFEMEIKPDKGFNCLYNAGEIIKKSDFIKKYAHETSSNLQTQSLY